MKGEGRAVKGRVFAERSYTQRGEGGVEACRDKECMCNHKYLYTKKVFLNLTRFAEHISKTFLAGSTA